MTLTVPKETWLRWMRGVYLSLAQQPPPLPLAPASTQAFVQPFALRETLETVLLEKVLLENVLLEKV